MNYSAYHQLFDEILNNPHPPKPYDDEMYLSYTRLNKSRMRRWDKQLVLDEQLVVLLKERSEPQHWIIVTEPWCGDAAHIVPFLIQMAQQSEHISYELQLRDSEPFLINSYLTNGSKSIPKLIVRDQAGKDVFTWGPRPAGAQQLMNRLKAEDADFETIKLALQSWYNGDRGEEVCRELRSLFEAVN